MLKFLFKNLLSKDSHHKETIFMIDVVMSALDIDVDVKKKVRKSIELMYSGEITLHDLESEIREEIWTR